MRVKVDGWNGPTPEAAAIGSSEVEAIVTASVDVQLGSSISVGTQQRAPKREKAKSEECANFDRTEEAQDGGQVGDNDTVKSEGITLLGSTRRIPSQGVRLFMLTVGYLWSGDGLQCMLNIAELLEGDQNIFSVTKPRPCAGAWATLNAV